VGGREMIESIKEMLEISDKLLEMRVEIEFHRLMVKLLELKMYDEVERLLRERRGKRRLKSLPKLVAIVWRECDRDSE
jgi:hypothetical protein